jgi:dTDP-4-amino-4,6-dideoxygalactose transaminase
MSIKFKETFYDKKEADAVNDALLNGTDYLSRAKEKLSGIYGNENIYLTANGSLALDTLLFACDFKKGSEVILPSFTYPSAANSILRRGLVPVFCDIDPRTLVMDIDDAIKKINENTVCVIPTHYGGASCDMDKLRDALDGIVLIEDAALSLGAEYKGKPLGTLGNASTVSFHKTKNVSSEEGGALIIRDEGIVDKVDLVYENGTDRRAFLRGEIPFYSWKEAGLNAGMSNIHAAILCAQLEKRKDIQDRQAQVFEVYMKYLSPLAKKYGFKLPVIPEYNTNNVHVFYIIFKDEAQRRKVKTHLNRQGIEAVIHYVPLHQSHMGEELGYSPKDLPNSLMVSKCLLRLPMHARLKETDCRHIAKQIGEALCE